MANEITFTGSLSCFKSTVMSGAVAKSVTALLRNMGGSYYAEGQVLAATGGTAIPLIGVTQPSITWLYNTDVTNFVRIANGSGGAKLLKLLAGDQWAFRFDDTAVPYAFADTAAVLLEYVIFSL